MQQIIFNIGVSGSGKTTWTTDQIKNNPNTLRINRDDLRRVLVGDLKGYYQRPDLNSIETIISNTEAHMIVEALRRNYNIIFDNTNLRSSYINDKINMVEHWSEVFNKDINIKFKIFNEINPDLLKLRVSQRDNISLNNDTAYIDKQIKSFNNIVSYIKEYYKDQIL